MLKTVKSKEELFSLIEKDEISNVPVDRRYPVRLIFVNNSRTFNSIIRYLNRKSKLIELSSLLPHDDGWITPDELIRKIRELTCTTLVVPFSEVLRFTKPDIFNSILVSLFEIENVKESLEKRIYIPIFGMLDRFQKEFYENFHRKNEWSPIWRIDEQVEKQITIYQINFPIKTNRNLLKTSSDWLNLWKCSRINSLISCSKSLGYLYENFLPDTIFRMEEISDYKAFIEEFLEIKIPIEYSEKEIEYWKKFSIELESKAKDDNCIIFEYYISDYFNLKSIFDLNNIEILKFYLDNSNKYNRWLLKSWIISHKKYEKSYLHNVMSDIKNFTNDELIRLTWLNIFSDNNYSREQLTERKQLIDFLHIQSSLSFSFIESEISITLKNIESKPFPDQSEYLTNVTISEREHIIRQFIKQKDLFRNLQDLKKVYPELYYYLSWDLPLDDIDGIQWVKDYFKEYCISKLLDEPTERLIDILDEKNSDTNTFYDWYYNINFYPEFKDAKVVWIDGLGAEWISLLYYIIDKNLENTNKSITNISIVKANLPSITDCNRFSDAEHLLDLDDFIHKEKPYKHPRSLIEQIELIETVVKDKILKFTDNRIIIVSDHGFTFLAQKKYGNFKKFNFGNAEHEGRCLWTEKEFKGDSNFLYHTIDRGPHKNKNVLMSLKYTSLQNTPSREVHGGATPEEVLVPYIEISTIHGKIEYEIELLTKEITTHLSKLKIIIAPHPNTKPYLTLDEKKYFLEKEKNYWCIELTGLSSGNYSTQLNVDHNCYNLFFKIRGGIKEEELF